MHKCRKWNRTGFLFVLPVMVIFITLLIYPVFSSIYFSFTTKHLFKPDYDYIGLQNYFRLLSDKEMWAAFGVSVKWTVYSLIGQILVGFTAALALNRIKRGQSFYRIALIVPWAFPSIIIAVSWKWLLNGVYGFIPNFLVRLGLFDTPPQFLSSSTMVFGTLAFINIWFGAPLIMVNVLSALQTIPKDQYEAAQIDGANGWQTFVRITLPHIRVVIGLLVVLRTIWVFNNFDTIYLITGGGPANVTASLPIFAYNLGWGLKQLGSSSAVTVLLMIFMLLICVIYFAVLNKWEKEEN